MGDCELSMIGVYELRFHNNNHNDNNNIIIVTRICGVYGSVYTYYSNK